MVVHVYTLLNTQKAEAGESVEHRNIWLSKQHSEILFTKEKGKEKRIEEGRERKNPYYGRSREEFWLRNQFL